MTMIEASKITPLPRIGDGPGDYQSAMARVETELASLATRPKAPAPDESSAGYVKPALTIWLGLSFANGDCTQRLEIATEKPLGLLIDKQRELMDALNAFAVFAVATLTVKRDGAL